MIEYGVTDWGKDLCIEWVIKEVFMAIPDKKTVLLVDDDPDIAALVVKVIQSIGYNVVQSDSGEKAVKIALENEAINLILMDIELGPGISGIEAAFRIHRKRKIPIIFHSAHSEKQYADQVKVLTNCDYVIKNSAPYVLQSSFAKALEIYEAAAFKDS